MLQQLCRDGGCALAEHVIKFEAGNSKTILGAFLLSGHAGREFDPGTAEIPELSDIPWRNEAAANEIMLEHVSDSLSFLSVFFSWITLTNFWMADDYMAGILPYIVDWESVLPGGFHADILAIVGE